MTADSQTARIFDVRDGFDLVDFREVGLPVFRLTVETVTLARQDMTTTNEFVLRAISIGETGAPDIARLLGLSEHDVVESLSLLRLDKCIESAPIGNSAGSEAEIESYQLTELGHEYLENGIHAPRDEVLVLDFDGLRRRPIKLGGESLLRPKELADHGAIQLRPYPADPPEATEINLREAARMVRRLSGKDFARTILAIRRIVRRENLFRPALGLLFRSRTTGEALIGFVLGDQVAEDYEIAFARHGGIKKPGLVRTSAEADDRAALRNLTGSELNAMLADPEDVSKRRLEFTFASRDRTELGKKLERLRRRSKPDAAAREELTAIEERLTDARAKLEEFELRPLAPYEQQEFVSEAAATAKKRLLITSDDVDSDLVDSFMLRKLDERLAANVEIRIETSITLNAIPYGKPGSFEPGVELWLRNQQQKRLTLAKRSILADNLYFLIRDNNLAIISNKPFLNRRKRVLSFVPTVGVVTHRAALVAKIAGLAGL